MNATFPSTHMKISSKGNPEFPLQTLTISPRWPSIGGSAHCQHGDQRNSLSWNSVCTNQQRKNVLSQLPRPFSSLSLTHPVSRPFSIAHYGTGPSPNLCPFAQSGHHQQVSPKKKNPVQTHPHPDCIISLIVRLLPLFLRFLYSTLFLTLIFAFNHRAFYPPLLYTPPFSHYFY